VTNQVRVHPTAEVSPRATVGDGTRIWNGAQVREDARIGSGCILGKNVYVDFAVRIGDRCKIQNNASLFHGATLEDGVFVGPHACLTNDRLPRAITPHGALKGADDWEVGPILLRYGCAIGAGAIILPNVTVGRFALVGAGSVVTRSVPDHGLVVGNPACLIGFVCACGGRLRFDGHDVDEVIVQQKPNRIEVPVPGSRHGHCERCGLATLLPEEAVAQLDGAPA
jgi:UDP-2-acetamido-3-amino-2,3-dideoxy-glucuronate N-acetyltransferase